MVNYIPFSGYTTVYQSMQLLRDKHVGCFQVLAIMNTVSVTSVYRDILEPKFSTPLGKNQEVWLLDYTVGVCLVFSESSKLSSEAAVPFCMHTSSARELLLLRILTSTWCCQCAGFWPLGSVCNGIPLLPPFAFPWWHMTWSVFSHVYFPFV